MVGWVNKTWDTLWHLPYPQNEPKLDSLTGKNLKNIMLSLGFYLHEVKTTNILFRDIDIKTITKTKRIGPKFKIMVTLRGEEAGTKRNICLRPVGFLRYLLDNILFLQVDGRLLCYF